jgi:hypothetical protein
VREVRAQGAVVKRRSSFRRIVWAVMVVQQERINASAAAADCLWTQQEGERAGPLSSSPARRQLQEPGGGMRVAYDLDVVQVVAIAIMWRAVDWLGAFQTGSPQWLTRRAECRRWG